MQLRRLLEKSLRGIVVKRNLPRNFGSLPIFVSPEAGLRYIFQPMKLVDPALLLLAQEFVHSGSTVWDIGANVGLFALAADHFAGRTGQVVAVEPDNMLVQLLQRSARANLDTVAPVVVIPAAVTGVLDIRRLQIANRARANNHLEGYGSTQTGGSRNYQTVIGVTLDWLSGFYPAPNVLKIDVEGAELEVLQGGVNVLDRSRPVLICEVTNQSTVSEVARLLADLDYQFWDADLSPSARVALDQPAYNTLAIPRH